MPPKATHESVKQLFKQFGNVAYVSLPKYRTSGRIKEFAFIEFEEKSSVEKCIAAFRQFDGVIGDTQDAEALTSVVSYVKEQEEIENIEKKNPEQSDEENENKTEIQKESDNEDTVIKAGTKRPNKEDVNSDSEVIPAKKRTKTESDDIVDAEIEGEGDGEAEQENDAQDNTDEKASVADDNQDNKKKR